MLGRTSASSVEPLSTIGEGELAQWKMSLAQRTQRTQRTDARVGDGAKRRRGELRREALTEFSLEAESSRPT
jgi:hypothetical protein